MTIREAIARLVDGGTLAEGEMTSVVDEVMEGASSPAQIGALLALLRRKGETVDEITGAARAMRARVTRIDAGPGRLLDTCGTGGDGRGTFNISTTVALVAAAAGCRVAKHGNRAMSGAVGGADVLEALGVRVDVEPAAAEALLREVGFAFLFAPRLHGAMKHAAGPRRELGVRTIFNLLGPLTNPAGAEHQLLGVFARAWVEPLAEVLGRLGSRHAMVVHGADGLDEISLSGPTHAAELRDGTVIPTLLEPGAFGFATRPLEVLRVASAAESAERVRGVLEGKEGPARDVVLLNAGVAIYVADLAPTIAAGIEVARESIASGRARALLDRVVALSPLVVEETP